MSKPRNVRIFLVALAAGFLTACTTHPPAVTIVEPAPPTPIPSAPLSPSPTTSAAQPSPETLLLASGTLDLPAASAFGQPGFHKTFQITARVPENIGPAAGHTLLIAIQDASRPGQVCSSQHPLSGCATVDWSDSPSRPNVPPGGVFDNSLAVQIDSGEHIFYLSENGFLANEPDAFDPG